MILSANRSEISKLNYYDCKIAILERRDSIRKCRDERGDDRCFLDDWFIWKWLSDSPPEPQTFSIKEGMKECALFFENRRRNEVDPIPAGANLNPARWDDDLENMTLKRLQDELLRLQEAIRTHRDITGRPRTFEDDQTLYEVLPEKFPADFRLPPREEFLGEALSPHAGCPSFWRSHSQCKTKCHNLHEWGPCK